MSAARRTPLIAAVPKMLFPFLVILPGMIAIGAHLQPGGGFALPKMADGTWDYDDGDPARCSQHYFPPGCSGSG